MCMKWAKSKQAISNLSFPILPMMHWILLNNECEGQAIDIYFDG